MTQNRISNDNDIAAYLGKSTLTDAENDLVKLMGQQADDAVREFLGYTVTQTTHTHFLPESDGFLPYADEEQLDVVNGRVTAYYSGGSNRLYLPERPVISITSINEDLSAEFGQGSGDFSGSNLTSGTDYVLQYTASGVSWSGCVRRVGGGWSTRAGTIKVVYVAGLTEAHLNGETTLRGPSGNTTKTLRHAANMAAVQAFLEAKAHQPSATGAAGAITSERLADYSVSYAQAAVNNVSMMLSLPIKVQQMLQPFRRLTI